MEINFSLCNTIL